MARIYWPQISKKFALSKKVLNTLNEEAVNRGKRGMNVMLQEFSSHAATREVQHGNAVGNITGTLKGVGTLKGFLGVGDPNIEEIKGLFMGGPKVTKNGTVRRNGFQFGQRYKVKTPDEDDISNAAGPLAWSSMSWVEAVEYGASGFEKFLRYPPAASLGRSTEGLQRTQNGDVRSGSMEPIPFISEILEAGDKAMRAKK